MNSMRPLNSRRDSEVAGKAKHLLEISRKGFQIPLSFYIDHQTLMKTFQQIPNFENRRKVCSIKVDDRELLSLEQQAQQALLPEEIMDELALLLKKYPEKVWIARSSFGVEDNARHSFAGCFRSEIIIEPSAQKMARGIMHVASAIFSNRSWVEVLASRNDPNLCEFGVIVQEYISGKFSGVAFSRDPNHAKLGYTDWVNGGCEAITNGESLGERAYFTKSSPVELSQIWPVLKQGMEKLESIFHGAVDVEWTSDGSNLWWLQARAAVSEELTLQKKSQGKTKWSRNKIAERFPHAMTPMGWSLIEETLEHSMKCLVNLTGLKCRNIERASLLYKGYAYGNEHYFRFPNCAFNLKSLGLLLTRTLFHGLRVQNAFMPKDQFYASLSHQVFLHSASKNVLAIWHEELNRHLKDIQAFDPSIEGEANVFDSCLEKISELRALSFAFFKTDLAIHFLKEANVHFITKVLASLGLKQEEVRTRIAQFANNETLTMHKSLQGLCQVLSTDKGAPGFLEALKTEPNEQYAYAKRHLTNESQRAFDAFLNQCGHMSEGWDVTSASLRENGAALSHLIRMALHRSPKNAHPDRTDIEELNLRGDLQEMFENTRSLCEADEQQHFFAGMYLEKSRKMLGAISQALISKGLIEDREDIFWLTAGELEEFLKSPTFSLKFFARRKKRIWSRYSEMLAPLELPSPPKPVSLENGFSNQLTGTAMSQGSAQGKLFFANGFDELENLPKDAILCLKTPNPSFVPWFDLCNAIITENGSPLSHGFIAARELQIPAVSGIRLSDLKPGSHATVDGSLGRILIHSS